MTFRLNWGSKILQQILLENVFKILIRLDTNVFFQYFLDSFVKWYKWTIWRINRFATLVREQEYLNIKTIFLAYAEMCKSGIHSFFSVPYTHLLFNDSKGNGCGSRTAFSGMHRFLEQSTLFCLPTSLCIDNTKNLHRSSVERILRQCPHII